MTRQEKEEKEFELLLADKRHKELISVFQEIKNLLSSPDRQQKALENKVASFENLLKELQKPEVKVEVRQEEVVKSVMEMSKNLLVELEKFNKRPIPVKFEVEVNRFGEMSAVNIMYKD